LVAALVVAVPEASRGAETSLSFGLDVEAGVVDVAEVVVAACGVLGESGAITGELVAVPAGVVADVLIAVSAAIAVAGPRSAMSATPVAAVIDHLPPSARLKVRMAMPPVYRLYGLSRVRVWIEGG